jgi:hypothetical protein
MEDSMTKTKSQPVFLGSSAAKPAGTIIGGHSYSPEDWSFVEEVSKGSGAPASFTAMVLRYLQALPSQQNESAGPPPQTEGAR